MIELSQYGIDPVRGFLPAEDPLRTLPRSFAPWDQLAHEIPALLQAGRLRALIGTLPPPDLDELENRQQLELAMLLFSVFGQAYVWGEPGSVKSIPRALARPWAAVGERLGRRPVASYATFGLYNWYRVRPDGPISLDNLACIYNFQEGQDESWFFLVGVAIEALGGAALTSLLGAQRADSVDATRHLKRLAARLETITTTLERTSERCDPWIFYSRVRPFMRGWDPPGLVYEETYDRPIVSPGASAAQSPLFHALDAGFGVEHPEKVSAFFSKMREQMSPLHSRFVARMNTLGADFRARVRAGEKRDPGLVDGYNECIRQLAAFRNVHGGIVQRYIINASRSGEARGTGGSSPMSFMEAVHQSTLSHVI